jgi:hypothetical protein
MSDYTIEELQDMLGQKIQDENDQNEAERTSSVEYIFNEEMAVTIKSNDYEMIVHQDSNAANMPIIRVHKSKTRNKQFIETPHYWEETDNGRVVAYARSYTTFTSASYGTNYTIPTMSILGTRKKDRSVYQG